MLINISFHVLSFLNVLDTTLYILDSFKVGSHDSMEKRDNLHGYEAGYIYGDHTFAKIKEYMFFLC